MTTHRPVKVRIAPSPTGDPHIGTAYIALFNMLLAKRAGGKFVVRIEDTDRQRYRADSEEQILASLRWLGLNWDEGPDTPDAPCGPYRQSERLPIYRKHAQLLVEKGKAYPCFCTTERLESVRKEQMSRKQNPGYDGHCRDLDPKECATRIAAGAPHTIRLKTPQEGQTTVSDLLRGEIAFENSQVDDQVLMKSDGYPTYHLAVVVDDHLMEITHVMRGEEWISSTPKHVQLYHAFGWPLPQYIHLPLLRNTDKTKISKRKNPTNILFYRRKGILPQALLNFLALMGYHPPAEQEKFTLDELAAVFDPTRIHLGGPVFDFKKLLWLNGLYLRDLPNDTYLEQLKQQVFSDAYLQRIVPLLKERVESLDSFLPKADFFFCGELDYSHAELVPRKGDPAQTVQVLQHVAEALETVHDWTVESLTAACEGVLASQGWKAKDVYMPMRIALTGRKDSPPLFETIEVLGKEIVRYRLRQAADQLRS
jgi:glutamyl-tRNA synthetase